ncbi:hypothetical protein DFH88_004459 [Clostridium saccharobutylicum]|nr:hypothetical protein [Clostridium saccharobutylicum]
MDGNLVTSPAWPGNTAILKDFLNLLKSIYNCKYSQCESIVI